MRRDSIFFLFKLVYSHFLDKKEKTRILLVLPFITSKITIFKNISLFYSIFFFYFFIVKPQIQLPKNELIISNSHFTNKV